MKMKGVIEDLKIKKIKLKNDSKNSKNISRTFSGVGSVGSVHFWIVPWSGLSFSRSIGPFLNHSSILAWRILGTEEPSGVPSPSLKGVIEDLKIKKVKKEEKGKKECKNSIYIYMTFSGVVVGSVGSVHFWIVP